MSAQSIRSEDLAEAIVAGLTDGIPLRQICRDRGVSKSAVYDWIDDDHAFAGRIARARVRGFDQIAEECLEIADDTSLDARIVGEDEREVANTEFIQRAKLRVETRLKLLAKWDPKRYGDKIVHAGDADNPITVTEIRRRVIDPASS